MITNYDIEEIAKCLKLNLVGVFSKDQLPQKRSIGSYYINMEDHDKGNGTHWVFARIFPNGKAIYFDSFGVQTPEPIRDFLKPFSPFACNVRQIQDIHSENCGRFCILLDNYFTNQLKVGNGGRSVKKKAVSYNVDELYDDWLNSWSIDTKLNDKILRERFIKLSC
jgi:hypothetical protein